VIFEDLHWIDEQTQALLDLLADNYPIPIVWLLPSSLSAFSVNIGGRLAQLKMRLSL
jgi:predicted ATPase